MNFTIHTINVKNPVETRLDCQRLPRVGTATGASPRHALAAHLLEHPINQPTTFVVDSIEDDCGAWIATVRPGARKIVQTHLVGNSEV